MQRTFPVAPTLPLLAPADARSGATGTAAAEIATFLLIPGSDTAAFLAAARATRAAVAAQPGFLRRVLSRDDAGLWTDHIEWADSTQARAAAKAVTALPDFGRFVGFIDLPGLKMRHAQVLWTMGD